MPKRAVKQLHLVNVPKSEPILKKAKVSLKDMKLRKEKDSEHENVSNNSRDSGISSSIVMAENNSTKFLSLVKTDFGTAILESFPDLKKSTIILERVKIKNEKDLMMGDNFVNSGVLSETPSTRTKLQASTAEDSRHSKHSDSSGLGEECSSSESEWEEVEEHLEQNLDDYKPEIPKEGVEITIGCPDLKLQRRKKRLMEKMEYVRLHINRQRKEAQLNVHKTHLLCFLAHGFYVNNILNSDLLKAIALSILPTDFLSMISRKKMDKVDCSGIEKIVGWFRSTFSFTKEKDLFVNLSENMIQYFSSKETSNSSEYNLIFIVFARCLGFRTRFCVSFYPVSCKAQNLLKKLRNKLVEAEKLSQDKNINDADEESKNVKKTSKRDAQQRVNVSRKKVNDVEFKSSSTKNRKISRPRRSVAKKYKISSDDDAEDGDFTGHYEDDEDFEKPKTIRKRAFKSPNRKILSDSEPSSPEVCGIDSDNVVCWAEVYSKRDRQWISVECVNNIVNKPYDIETTAPQPVTYIVAYDNDSHVKDVTRRYCSEYMTSTIKLRPDSKWWDKTLEPFLPPSTNLDKEEENGLETMLINKPLPHTISGFKNHPLYALKRHLLKFEAIYPPDAGTVGFMRGEAVYPRECICLLHTREKWVKQARVVRVGEEPYKVVKCLRWDKINRVILRDVPTDLFGFWQTELYEPPTAVNGIVPRNEYGNVDLFKHSMLPKGTVYLQNPGLNRIAKKLGIDCSPAIVGFQAKRGSPHPVFDGFVVCEEFKDKILAAWEEEQKNARIKEAEKKEKRIYGNWKKLIRGLLIRERIKLKYDKK